MKKQKRRKLQRELQREIYCNSCTPNLSYRDIFTMNCISRGKSFNQSDFDNYILSDKKAKNIMQNVSKAFGVEWEIKELEESLNEQGKKLLDSVYYKRIPINKNMEEKNCLNCKNVSLQGMVFECTKNNLDINKPQIHSCDMHEEKNIVYDYIVQRLELVKSGVSVTLTDKTRQCHYEFILDMGYADKLKIGDPFKISFR
jgi:hypothetical protein